ncbi:uncharacterized protein PTI45_04326 [Paenibacillus nuruki]|jgi:uncharacterized protein YcnI|uniref:YncI copper-binding domain-containing protein n=1 Tax=Paenibacillus nuruki TaxID=1886670 RepID=A0A1E3KYB2_9BACL|nr:MULTISPECIES: DUF1775 domain-containing protein [Paenibacillus]ODP26486.1 uncharacterized protein PTI45_04326 [Paenibacillus nuruki]TKJ89164.1 DUF1775 domain-containing protein [Paenibacillus sp. CFBP13512]
MKTNSVFTKMITIGSAVMVAGFLTFSSIASAHVTVKPAQSMPSAWETYTIKVPSEKDLPTTKVTLKVPENLSFKQYQPVPGWKTTTEKNDADEITSITWEAESGGIEAGQFQQFVFVGENPAKDGELAWDAYQYYSDGSVVEWTGKEGSELPHSITTITENAATATPAAPTTDGHDAAATEDTATATDEATGTDTTATTPATGTTTDTAPSTDMNTMPMEQPASSNGLQVTTLIIAIIALVLGGVAVMNSRKRK